MGVLSPRSWIWYGFGERLHYPFRILYFQDLMAFGVLRPGDRNRVSGVPEEELLPRSSFSRNSEHCAEMLSFMTSSALSFVADLPCLCGKGMHRISTLSPPGN